MTDTASLRIAVDSKGVRQSRQELERLSDTGTRTARRVKTATGNMRAGFDRLRTSIVPVGAALAGVTAGLGYMTARTIDAFKETDSLARAIGINTGVLQEYEYAASRVGISGEKMGDILKDVSDKIGDAFLTGGGEAIDVLEKLDLAARDLVKLGPDKQLLAIADALEGMPRATQVFALESLGDDATRLIPLLEDGGRALQAAMRDARNFGVAVSNVEADQLREAAAAMSDLRGIAKGLANQIAIGTTPAINELGETLSDPQVQEGLTTLTAGFSKVVEWSAKASAGVTNFIAGIGRDMGRLYGITGGPIERTQHAIEELQGQLANLPEAPRQLGGGIVDRAGMNRRNELEAELETQNRILEDYRKQKEYFDELYSGGQDKPNTPVLTPNTATGQTDASASAQARQIIDVPDRIGISTQGERDREALQSISASLQTQEERIQESYDRRTDIVLRAVDDQEKQKAMLAGLDAQRLTSLEQLSQNTYDNMSVFATRARENIQDELGDTLSQTLRGDFDGILDSWGSMLIEMAAQAQAAQLANALFGKEGGDSGGGLLGTLGNAAIGAIGNYFGGGVGASVGGSITASGGGDAALSLGSLSGIAGARATGGPVSGGSSYLVGERGPEIFNPASGGNIIPNNQINQPAANVNLDVQIINEGGQMQEQKREHKRGPNGQETIKIYVKQAMAQMVGSGEMDSVMAPYGRRSGQV